VILLADGVSRDAHRREFLRAADEGGLALYMAAPHFPAFPSGRSQSSCSKLDRLIRTVPEVATTVFGKAGRRRYGHRSLPPLEMFETTIQLQSAGSVGGPRMTPDKLAQDWTGLSECPAGLTNVWVPPIRNRIDMLATGIKTPVGVKVAGDATCRRLTELPRRSNARRLKNVPGVTSAFAERLTGGRLYRCRHQPCPR